MADVIVLHAPKDQALARAIASGLDSVRVLTMPVAGQRSYFNLGDRMVRLVAWSAEASARPVLPALTELSRGGGGPLALVLCDNTPPPEALLNAADATIAFRGPVGERRAAIAAAVSSLLEARANADRDPAAPFKALLRRVLFGFLAFGLTAGALFAMVNFGPRLVAMAAAPRPDAVASPTEAPPIVGEESIILAAPALALEASVAQAPEVEAPPLEMQDAAFAPEPAAPAPSPPPNASEPILTAPGLAPDAATTAGHGGPAVEAEEPPLVGPSF